MHRSCRPLAERCRLSGPERREAFAGKSWTRSWSMRRLCRLTLSWTHARSTRRYCRSDLSSSRSSSGLDSRPVSTLLLELLLPFVLPAVQGGHATCLITITFPPCHTVLFSKALCKAKVRAVLMDLRSFDALVGLCLFGPAFLLCPFGPAFVWSFASSFGVLLIIMLFS